MGNRSNIENEAEVVDLKDRLLAAFLAPLFMNISVLIVVAWVFQRSHYMGRMFYHYINFPFSTGKIYFLSLCVMPCIIGFALGTNRFINFAGHCFMTHFSSREHDVKITVLIWACILEVSYFVAKSI